MSSVQPFETVTGTLLAVDGSPEVGVKLVFDLKEPGQHAGSASSITTARRSVVTDENGAFSVQLFRTEDDLGANYYTLSRVVAGGLGIERLVDPQNFSVPAGGPFDFAALVQQFSVQRMGLDAKIAAAAVNTRLNADRAQSARDEIDPVGMAATLQQQVADGVTAVQAQFDGARDAIIQGGALAPNVLPDTKAWDTLCGGQKNVEMNIADAADGSAYDLLLDAGVTATAKVVPFADFAAEGLPTDGAIAAMVGSDPARVQWCALILDVQVSAADAQARLSVEFGQVAAEAGGHVQATSVYAAVLPGASGDVQCKVATNFAHVTARVTDAGQGWQHMLTENVGSLKWPVTGIVFDGVGSMRIALVLPYLRHAAHGNAHLWANEHGKFQ